MSIDNIKNVVQFYVLSNSLKDKIRSGWILWNVSKERLESVAEHVYGTCILAIAVESEFELNLDLGKVLKMLVLHELEEILIGDITPYDNISEEEKLKLGRIAVKQLLHELVKSNEYEELLNEFNVQVTSESRFAFCCDKLEACLQAKLYDEGCYTNINDKRNENLINKEWNKTAILNGASNLSDLFINYDINRVDDIFREIFIYIQNNKIGV